MIRLRHNASFQEQRGAVIMIMLLILIMGSAYFLLTKLNKGDARQPRTVDATIDLGAITAALIGYAQSNAASHCLPCPSLSATNGVAPAGCDNSTRAGYLPWETLGLGDLDSWGHRLRYSVDPDYTTGCDYSDTALDMNIQTRDNAGLLQPVALASPPVAVIVSLGANGFGARAANGTAQPNPPASHVDELTNQTATTSFMQRTLTDDPTVTGGPFDDLVVWVTRQELRDQVDTALGGTTASPVLPP